ncbi:glucose-1-phosphate adenylyltransferase family protein [Nocardioides marmotae]|uniref:Glucose-1-phosphate adenylyltransferase n=1 Tax=Nocardioides marmotae TaxID=2663857 RepID=A0A6I3JAN2_9ACTN|nr:sugar phosphate nucleotidyltransferase [Nocardioides marmotae]MCR6031376.1 glucose-1-phosphate adenylyltransferase [Gordonia jinghuaiqii]MBC9735602.1 glucose-1-phosphate adenylyltransferase [Nocardioides marmotae]MTB86698.1 glucose-1-phosphate adenylyltransferase [Nocardioides marmotae]MTB95015.1 glucose-1-phosphate adenylyltransferase [Nocardioides marmotae]QKE02484.1 glucose-1-phosphate adenylyltransferase [Nocardioides marmotae]
MVAHRVLAIVQAGGAGGRMDVLTRERAKPALPFAGVYQLLDFPLSNLTHSGCTDVWLSVQYQGATLEEQVANGRPWDLDRNTGGLRLLMPQQGSGSLDEDGFARGNADLLFRIRDQVQAFDPEVVLVMSADHVYRFDYRDAIVTHHEHGAECTVVTSEVPLENASDHATVEHDDDGRVTRLEYKPEEPTTGTVATEVFVYDPAVLVTVLEELHRELSGETEAGDTGLGDFGEHLLPRLVERGKVVAHPMPGYWRDLGQPHHYLDAHRELLTEDRDVLGVPDWTILTRQPQRQPARVLEGATVTDSMLSPGCRVAGEVTRSVLGPGVVVEEGAAVVDSVVFADTVVRRGAAVHRSIVDTGCEVGPGARVGDPDAPAFDDPDAVTIVGRHSTVGAGVELAAGSRLEPGTTA